MMTHLPLFHPCWVREAWLLPSKFKSSVSHLVYYYDRACLFGGWHEPWHLCLPSFSYCLYCYGLRFIGKLLQKLWWYPCSSFVWAAALFTTLQGLWEGSQSHGERLFSTLLSFNVEKYTVTTRLVEILFQVIPFFHHFHYQSTDDFNNLGILLLICNTTK